MSNCRPSKNHSFKIPHDLRVRETIASSSSRKPYYHGQKLPYKINHRQSHSNTSATILSHRFNVLSEVCSNGQSDLNCLTRIVPKDESLRRISQGGIDATSFGCSSTLSPTPLYVDTTTNATSSERFSVHMNSALPFSIQQATPTVSQNHLQTSTIERGNSFCASPPLYLSLAYPVTISNWNTSHTPLNAPNHKLKAAWGYFALGLTHCLIKSSLLQGLGLEGQQAQDHLGGGGSKRPLVQPKSIDIGQLFGFSSKLVVLNRYVEVHVKCDTRQIMFGDCCIQMLVVDDESMPHDTVVFSHSFIIEHSLRVQPEMALPLPQWHNLVDATTVPLSTTTTVPSHNSFSSDPSLLFSRRMSMGNTTLTTLDDQNPLNLEVSLEYGNPVFNVP